MTPAPTTRPCLAAALLLLGAAAGAATVQVQVQVHDGAGAPLDGAVVFLESREARAAVKPARNAEIAQVGKQFSPQVAVVPVGTLVDFPNRDTVRHHVYSFAPIKTFELKLYAGTPSNPVLFDKPGVAVLGCNIHDNMAAWVVVVDTPYFGRAPASGRVVLEDVPAGQYRLRAWHPGLAVGAPALDQPLSVAAAGATATVRLVDVVK
jgi:plastocyanin